MKYCRESQGDDQGCVQLEIACDSIRWGLKFDVPSENGNKRNRRIPLSLLVLVVFL